MNKNVNIVTDLDGRKIVLINDVRFKSRRSFDWDTIEEYILALISPMSSVIQKIK